MSAKLFAFMIFLLVICPVQALSDDNSEASAVLHAFFKAVQSGDVTGVLDSVTNPIKSRLEKALLPDVTGTTKLSERYGGADFQVQKITNLTEREQLVKVLIIKKNEEYLFFDFLMVSNNENEWSIADISPVSE